MLLRGLWQKEWRKGKTRPLCHLDDVSGQDVQAYAQEHGRSKQKYVKYPSMLKITENVVFSLRWMKVLGLFSTAKYGKI